MTSNKALEALARIIEPSAWENHDAAIRPYAENRGAGEGEQALYGRTWKLGMRSVKDVQDWLFDAPYDGGSHPVFVCDLRESLTKAAACIAALSSPEGLGEPTKQDCEAMTKVLMDAFIKAEPKHPISQNPTPYVATFAEMAMAAIGYTGPFWRCGD